MTKDFWIGYATASFVWLVFAVILGWYWGYPIGSMLAALWFIGKRQKEEEIIKAKR